MERWDGRSESPYVTATLEVELGSIEFRMGKSFVRMDAQGVSIVSYASSADKETGRQIVSWNHG